MKRLLAFAAAAWVLAGCGGGGSGTSVPAGAAKSPAASAQGSVVLSIPVASPMAQTLKRPVLYPQFVSPAATSVTLSVNGTTPLAFDVSTSSPLCTTTAGARNCTLGFGAPVGSDTFAFVIFAGANGSGTQLASATTTQTIAAGVAFNFSVAMNAAVGTIIVGYTQQNGTGNCPDGPSSFNGFNEGCPGSVPLTITVEDPSGAAITGSAPYATPLQITTNEPTITVTPATITTPGQTATVSYTGVPWQSITTLFSVNVTAGGQTGGLSVPVQQSNLYVANSNALPGTTPAGGGNVAVYRFGASGTATPLRTITGLNNPVQPMLDASGNLWVLDNGPYTSTAAPYVNVYAPGATGNATPIKRITGFAALDYNTACETMAFTPNQSQLFVTCDDGAIHVFPTSFTGTVSAASAQTVSLTDDSWEDPIVGMAFDNSGNIYVADSGFSAIYQYGVASLPTSGSYQLIGTANIMSGSGGSWPSNVTPVVLLVDNAGTLYATIDNFSPTAGAADANNQIAVWKTTTLPCSNCQPTATLTGAPFTTHAATGIILDPAGNLYVSNPYTNTINVFAHATISAAAPGTANPPVLRTLNTGSSPSAPNGMAIGP